MAELSRELLPCPFCGGTDIDTHFSLDGAGNVTTGCMTCGASGPETATPDESKGAEAWNRRAALSDDSVRVPRDLLDRCIERSSSDAPNYAAIKALRKWLAASEREAG
jgi:Lar family restriction alleviation protein